MGGKKPFTLTNEEAWIGNDALCGHASGIGN
jgi:hypothetical protein